MGQNSSKSIREWTDTFSGIYFQADSKRTPEQMWIAVMAHSSSIGESIRKVAFEELLDSAAHTFCWLCSFVSKCNTLQDSVFSIREPLCGIVSLKYPDVCGHCTQKPCDCDSVKAERATDKSAAYKELLERRRRILSSFENYTIEDSRKTFGEIYGGRIHIQTLENIGFHFLEEIGEAAVSVRKLSQLKGITQDNTTLIDTNFLQDLSTIDGIVNNYVRYNKPKLDYASKEPDMLKARLVEAKMSLAVEIGDSFSWFCAILNKLDFISKSIFKNPQDHPEILQPLEKILCKTYIDSAGNARCPTCHSKPCSCVFYNFGTEH